MSASETAEAILIVIKRLGKWMLWLIAGIAGFFLLVLGWMEGKHYFDNRPYRATKYAEISIGDTQDKIIYLLGPPPNFIKPSQKATDENHLTRFDEVANEGNADRNSYYPDAIEWLYTDGAKRIDLKFDAPGGRVKSVACYSESYYLCPRIYGLSDGSSENDVLAQLGTPESEKIDGVTKIIRYPKYNLTLYLTKRQVYMLKLSNNASE